MSLRKFEVKTNNETLIIYSESLFVTDDGRLIFFVEKVAKACFNKDCWVRAIEVE